jgi:hypothetical protein
LATFRFFLLRRKLFHLQLVHVPHEFLKELFPLRTHTLLKLRHDLVWRQRPIEVASHANFPSDNFGQCNKASEISLRKFLTQDRKYLLAMTAPVVFQIGEKGC